MDAYIVVKNNAFWNRAERQLESTKRQIDWRFVGERMDLFKICAE
jgi:hypothetical protein